MGAKQRETETRGCNYLLGLKQGDAGVLGDICVFAVLCFLTAVYLHLNGVGLESRSK